jgi:hypothetical protein
MYYFDVFPSEKHFEKQHISHSQTKLTLTENRYIQTEIPRIYLNYRRILPTEIFSRYLPRELQWEKNN